MDSKKVAGTILSVSFKTCVLFLVIMFTVFFGRIAYRFGVSIFHEYAMSESTGIVTEVEVVLPQNASDMEVAKILQQSGLVNDSKLFYVQLMLSDYSGKIVSGTYTLSTDMKPTQIMAAISPAKTEENSGD